MAHHLAPPSLCIPNGVVAGLVLPSALTPRLGRVRSLTPQVAVANWFFGPNASEVEQAYRVVEVRLGCGWRSKSWRKLIEGLVLLFVVILRLTMAAAVLHRQHAPFTYNTYPRLHTRQFFRWVVSSCGPLPQRHDAPFFPNGKRYGIGQYELS